jgi:hypothetical protein
MVVTDAPGKCLDDRFLEARHGLLSACCDARDTVDWGAIEFNRDQKPAADKTTLICFEVQRKSKYNTNISLLLFLPAPQPWKIG